MRGVIIVKDNLRNPLLIEPKVLEACYQFSLIHGKDEGKQLLYLYQGVKPALTITEFDADNGRPGKLTDDSKKFLNVLKTFNPNIEYDDNFIVNNKPREKFEPFQYIDLEKLREDIDNATNLSGYVREAFSPEFQNSQSGTQYLSYFLGFGPTYHTFKIHQEKEGMPREEIDVEDIVLSKKALELVGEAHTAVGDKTTYEDKAAAYVDMINKMKEETIEGVIGKKSSELEKYSLEFKYTEKDLQTSYFRELVPIVNDASLQFDLFKQQKERPLKRKHSSLEQEVSTEYPQGNEVQTHHPQPSGSSRIMFQEPEKEILPSKASGSRTRTPQSPSHEP